MLPSKPLFALTDQPNFYRCSRCGSTDIERVFVQQLWRMPNNIEGYVEPTVLEPERDNFGPITTRTTRATRTVRCR
jgi:hypothetical protein